MERHQAAKAFDLVDGGRWADRGRKGRQVTLQQSRESSFPFLASRRGSLSRGGVPIVRGRVPAAESYRTAPRSRTSIRDDDSGSGDEAPFPVSGYYGWNPRAAASPLPPPPLLPLPPVKGLLVWPDLWLEFRGGPRRRGSFGRMVVRAVAPDFFGDLGDLGDRCGRGGDKAPGSGGSVRLIPSSSRDAGGGGSAR
jgi:hypothetical protein